MKINKKIPSIIITVLLLITTIISFSPSISADPDEGWEKIETNIALNERTAIYNSHTEFNDPSKAVDGNKNSKAVIGGKAPSDRAMLGVDIGEQKYIYEVKITVKRLYTVSVDKPDYPEIKLQIGDGDNLGGDDKDWKDIKIWHKEIPNNQKKTYTINCLGEKTNGVRIFKTRSGGLLQDMIEIYEIEIYPAKDVSSPGTNITSGPKNGEYVDQNFNFEWKGEDNAFNKEIRYKYKLEKADENSEWSKWTSKTSKKYKNMPEGEYIFQVKSKDAANNIESTPASRHFYIDKSEPKPSIEWPKPGYFYWISMGREVIPGIKLEDDSKAVVVGQSEIEVNIKETGSGIGDVGLFVLDYDPELPIIELSGSEIKDKSCSFPIYNGEHTYKILVADKADKFGSTKINIRGILTHQNLPGQGNINSPPYQKAKPKGIETGETNKSYTFTCEAKDADNDQIYYLIDWGDGKKSGWIGPYPSDKKITVSHSWEEEGTYKIKVKTKDTHGNNGDWYAYTTVEIEENDDSKNQDKNIHSDKKKIFSFNKFFGSISKKHFPINDFFNSLQVQKNPVLNIFSNFKNIRGHNTKILDKFTNVNEQPNNQQEPYTSQENNQNHNTKTSDKTTHSNEQPNNQHESYNSQDQFNQ